MEKIEFLGKCLLITNEKKKTLVIGDLHLGYEDVLNRGGVFVSKRIFEENIQYLDKIFDKTGRVDEVILLGDVKHEFGRIIRQEWSDISQFLEYLEKKSKKSIIIKGNHDKVLEPIVKGKKVVLLDYYINKKFCFLHGDKDFENVYDKKIEYWVLGHAHPAIKIGDGTKTEKYKCFLIGVYKKKKIVVVPSFTEANVGSDPRENVLGLAWNFDLENFNVRVVSGDEFKVFDFGKLGKL